MLKELKSLKINDKVLKDFGLLVGGIFILLGVLSLWKKGELYPVFLTLGAVLAVPALAFPRILKPVYYFWMALGMALGEVISRIILSVVFLLVLSPIALVMKITGHRFLELGPSAGESTYWTAKAQDKPKDSYRKQY